MNIKLFAVTFTGKKKKDDDFRSANVETWDVKYARVVLYSCMRR